MTTTADDLQLMIKAADPLDRAELDTWSDRFPTEQMLARVYADASPARRGHRRIVPIAAVAAILGLGAAGVAAATGLLGGPAPDQVKESLAGLDRGMPADLRYNPDIDNARGVAETAGGAVYLADTADGGYCLEVASKKGRPGGASCVTAGDLKSRPLDVLAPIPANDEATLLIGGRANSDAIVTMRARFADGDLRPIAFGLDRAWLLEVSAEHRASVLADGLLIEGISATGAATATQQVPPLRDEDPQGMKFDATQPLVLQTISDDADLTRVLGIEGKVNVPGSATLTVRYPDGSSTSVPVAPDGRYEFRFPANRQDDFARSAGALVVTRDGAVVASRPISSVAHWRARNG